MEWKKKKRQVTNSPFEMTCLDRHLATTSLTLATGSQLKSFRCGNTSEANCSGGKACSFKSSEHRRAKVCLLFHFLEWAKRSANVTKRFVVSPCSVDVYLMISVICKDNVMNRPIKPAKKVYTLRLLFNNVFTYKKSSDTFDGNINVGSQVYPVQAITSPK